MVVSPRDLPPLDVVREKQRAEEAVKDLRARHSRPDLAAAANLAQLAAGDAQRLLAYLSFHLIAHHSLDGVHISGSTTQSNFVSEVSIYDNDLGINLENDANGNIPAPGIVSVTLEAGSVVIRGKSRQFHRGGVCQPDERRRGTSFRGAHRCRFTGLLGFHGQHTSIPLPDRHGQGCNRRDLSFRGCLPPRFGSCSCRLFSSKEEQDETH